MAPSSSRKRGGSKALALSTWLYGLFLHVYPTAFRRAYGSRMIRVFRDSCRDALQRQSIIFLFLLWLQTITDLLSSACLERWTALKEKTRTMTSPTSFQNFPLRLWIALAATLLAFGVSLVASLHLYLLEDANPLTRTAYAASSFLRFSYDGVYLSALAAGVAVCTIVGYVVVQRTIFVAAGLILVALLVAFGGFGGLLVRHSATFLMLFAIFLALTLISFLCGRAVTTYADRLLEKRPAAVLGACASVGSMLLVNIVALVLHTLLLNPVSHTLYMQGQIEGTRANFSLIAMGLALLTLLAWTLSLGYALRPPSSLRR